MLLQILFSRIITGEISEIILSSWQPVVISPSLHRVRLLRSEIFKLWNLTLPFSKIQTVVSNTSHLSLLVRFPFFVMKHVDIFLPSFPFRERWIIIFFTLYEILGSENPREFIHFDCYKTIQVGVYVDNIKTSLLTYCRQMWYRAYFKSLNVK